MSDDAAVDDYLPPSDRLEAIRAERAFAMAELGNFARWLTASLLAVNSGGLIAILNADKLHGAAWAALCFGAGLLTAC